MLYGRREERVLIAALLAGARGGHSGVLVVHGETGIGKRTLLQDAAEQADGFQILRGAGVESEMALAYAGLHQLLRPALEQLDLLPPPQASALAKAFGLADGPADRFLAELAVLGLLAQAAQERPVLCLVTDAQWLDRASADALVFVARRLEIEPIVLLLAAADGNGHRFHAPGLPSLRLGGLDREAAGHLLAARGDTLAPAVATRLIDQTAGHPLALVELPQALSSEQLAGRAPLPERLALGSRLERAFLPGVRQLPTASQTLLLLASAEDTGELATVLAAGAALGVDSEGLEAAERVGLVQVRGSKLRFRHRLVGSAIYQGATFSARQEAHRALIAVLASELHADRRAWHLAAAATGPTRTLRRRWKPQPATPGAAAARPLPRPPWSAPPR
jgi:AAA ATPase-like protein